MAAYIVLANSDASMSKRFRVVHGTYARSTKKLQTRQRTVTGKADVQEGYSWRAWQMTLQLLHPDPGGGAYGTHADLLAFYRYNDPTIAPSEAITFTDPTSTSFTTRFTNHEALRRLAATWANGEPTHVPIALEEA